MRFGRCSQFVFAAVALLGLSACVTGNSVGSSQQQQVPLAMQGRWPVVTVHLNGQPEPYVFIVDTAAGATVLDVKLAEKLGLRPTVTGTTMVQGASGAESASQQMMLSSIQVGSFVSPNLEIVTTDMGSFDAETRQYAGILGNDFLGRYSYAFDVPSGFLTLSTSRVVDASRWTNCIPNALGPNRSTDLQNFVAAPFAIGTEEAVGVVDTGAAGTVLNPLFGDLVRSNATDIVDARVVGFDPNAATSAYRMTVSNLRVGQVTVPSSVRVAPLPVFETVGLTKQKSGILGINVLKFTSFAVDRGSENICFEGAVNSHQ